MAATNHDLLRDLLDRRLLPIAPGGLDRLPVPAGRPRSWDRVEGMLIGLAIGDALGNTTESMNPAERRARHPEIRDYLRNHHAGDRAVGLPSDDTQLAFWTVEHLLKHRQLVPAALSDAFSDGRRIFGIGRSVREFLSARRRGTPWERAGAESAGNGAVMRIAPVLLPHLGGAGPELVADVLLAGAITHRDPASLACCVAFVHVLWTAASGARPSFLRDFVDVVRALEGDEPRYQSRMPLYAGRSFPLAGFTEEVVTSALERGTPTVEACNGWGSGAYLLETIPSALLLLERHAGDPEEAIVRAVNDTRDNDTVAAIVGAAVGALHGAAALPRRWVAGLLGRTGETDDGHVFDLIDRARDTFGRELAP